MNIAADTNVLIRALVADDAVQANKAIKLLESADTVAVSLHALCELVWVLRRSYGVADWDIATAIRSLMDTDNIAINRPAVELGLRLLENGGNFADGVIAYEGAWLGGDTFVSFDKQAVKLLGKQGMAAKLL